MSDSEFPSIKDKIFSSLLSNFKNPPSCIEIEEGKTGKALEKILNIMEFPIYERVKFGGGENKIFVARRNSDFIISGKFSPIDGYNLGFDSLYIVSENIENAEQVYKELVKNRINKPNTSKKQKKIYILTHSSFGGYSLRENIIKSPQIDIGLHYDNFESTHNKIISKLTKERGGVFLFSGEPGTGKTNYIRLLTKLIPDRKFIFIPPFMIDGLVAPDLIGLLLDNQNCVLVIEDAEKALIKREGNPNASLVSTVLNLSDGFMADAIQSSLILTFNCSEDNIDPALLRKGRLKIHHKFNKLSIEQSNKLIKLAKKDYVAKEPMSLAEIYNLDDETGHKEKEVRKIGFNNK